MTLHACPSCTCTLPNRDYSKMFTGTGRCVICQQERTTDGMEFHAAMHLANGEAVVVVSYTSRGRTETVEPMPQDTPSQAVLLAKALESQRKPDPKLVALARAALKRAQGKS